MKIKLLFCSFLLLTPSLFAQFIDANKNGKMDIYENPKAKIEDRVKNLMSQMTLDEKIAQMCSFGNIQMGALNEELPEKSTADIKNGIGQLSRSGETLFPEQTVERINTIQKYLLEKTRLGIPAIVHEETLHGVMMSGATVFPQAIAMGSSWNPTLVEEVSAAIAKETRSRGSNLSLSPNLDLAKDPRYGRTEETYGEDPYLTSQYAIAAVNGFQGKDYLIGKDHIGATVKHFGASAQPFGGLNLAPNYMNERTMREADLVPFRAAIIEANAASIMAGYVEYDGVSCHANSWLLTNLLRNEWGFKGIVVSDYGGIERIVDLNFEAETIDEAAKMSIEAGMDVELPGIKAFKNLKKLVETRKLDVKYIDRSLRSILTLKFRLGLFEDRFADAEYAKKVNHSPEHKALALKAAEESIVLLKNDNKTLPIDLNKVKSIAVIGPNAKHAYMGGYTTLYSADRGVTVFDGINNYVGSKAEVKYAEGCKIHLGDGYWRSPEAVLNSEESDLQLIKEAVEVAKTTDVVVLVIGETPRICRENNQTRIGDRDDLNLFGRQQLLVDEILKLGKPTIVYLMNGRPISIVKIMDQAPAIIEGWYEGEETGNAVANILFGKVNPSGRLSISFPRSVGHIPSYYNKKASALVLRYVLEKNEALFPFGLGLSYTNFEYSDLTIDTNEIKKDGSTIVKVKVTNTGDYDGKEVVQMYIRDNVSSVTRPLLELKGFEKIFLKKRESKTVAFQITPDKLKFFDRNMHEVVEPGKFTIYVGKSSVDLKSVELNVVD
ncbi:MAG: glycoside hydrolase family 3 N-terminal domain-containing protein [Paludibacter sp.]|nr:glycoside hydrolase family 3 N-terminal domain-containing protein [Paludibacter sp.]